MNDWAEFVEAVPWFLGPGDDAIPDKPRAWSGAAIKELPALSALLMQATITPVTIGDRKYELFAWGVPGSRRGWLCVPSLHETTLPVHATHRLFWSVSGGIVERFGEPVSWWNNQDAVLTADVAEADIAAVLKDYAWLWEDEGMEVPIRVQDYYAVAVEANGNLTLAHRETGQILLFAPDHAFDGVTEVPGCPPYSLLTIDEAPNLTAWIEVTADAWQ